MRLRGRRFAHENPRGRAGQNRKRFSNGIPAVVKIINLISAKKKKKMLADGYDCTNDNVKKQK